MAEQMTVTRALAELKLLQSRIDKGVTGFTGIDVFQKRSEKRAVKTNMPKDEFEKKALSSWESVNDLIKRRAAIKTALLRSNAETKVKIGGVEFSVIEAIERKNSIEFEKSLLRKMKANHTAIMTSVEQARARLDDQVEKMILQNLGTDKKTDKEDFERIAKPFIEANEYNLIDPLKLGDKIDALDESIDNFETEVDFVLSESNAKTNIELPERVPPLVKETKKTSEAQPAE